MKIAMRLFVLTLVLSAAGFAQSGSFAGPGIPVPPAVAAGPGIPVPPAVAAGPGIPVPPSAE